MHICDADALDKLASVEGGRWRRHQLDRDGALYAGFFKALRQWTQNRSSEVIYGGGGWNRYRVNDDGEIVMIRAQACADDIPKAEKAGIRVA